MKAVAFGSCMSNLTIGHLVADYGFTQSLSVHHNRSDAFDRYAIAQSATMIPPPFFDTLLKHKPAFEKDARQFLANQYPDTIGFHDMPQTGNFFDVIATQPADVILMDNYMDIAAKLVVCRSIPAFSQSPLFLNAGFYANEAEINALFDWWGDFLTPAQSVFHTMRIYAWLRTQQPRAKIFFLPFHWSSSSDTPDRVARARDFYPALAQAASGADLHIIPPLNVPPELTHGMVDWPHFQPQIYRALAGYVYLHVIEDLSKPYIRPRRELG